MKERLFPYRGLDHRIPSAEEVIEAFPTTPLLIEIKTKSASAALRVVLESKHAEDRTVVDSFDGEALSVYADSNIPVGASRGDVARAMAELLLHLPLTPFAFRALCVPLESYGLPIPVRRFVRAAPSQSCVVHVWTINDPVVATRLWNDGVQGIITDDPALMLRLAFRNENSVTQRRVTIRQSTATRN